MNEFDKQIKEAFGRDAEDALGELDHEQGLFEQMAGTFRGWQRRWTILIFGATFVFFVLSIVCAVQFFGTTDTRLMIMWSTLFLFFQIGVGMMKMWNWMLMNRNAVTREIKRLELRVASLGSAR